MSAMLDRAATAIGLARSLAVYYGQPQRRRAMKAFYGALLPAGGLAFDIGAHVGNRSRTLLSLGLRVVALEPQPAFADFLSWSLGKRLVLVRAAVGAQPGTAKMRISRRHPTVSTLSREFIDRVGDTKGFRNVAWDGTATVEVTTLDRLIDRHGVPDFAKIDVEGMEAEILAGLSQPLPLVAFEYLPATAEIAIQCVDRLEALGGYEYNRVVGESGTFVDPQWVDAREMRAALSSLRPEEPSGDVYARRLA